MPAFIGLPGAREKTEIGRGLFERSEFRSPPDGDRSDKPKGPITAAVLLGSFFSLLRKMNK